MLCCIAFVSNVRLSGFVGVIQEGMGRLFGLARLSSEARFSDAVVMIYVGLCVMMPARGCLMAVSLCVSLVDGFNLAETFKPLW